MRIVGSRGIKATRGAEHPLPMPHGIVNWLRFGSLLGSFSVFYGEFQRIFYANSWLGFRIRAAPHGRSTEEEWRGIL
jgi:hypothetical protein